MCMFCAAVPTVAALGLAVRGEQKEKIQEAQARGEPPPRSLVPAGKATAAALAVVVLAAVLYHVQISSA
jgi:hypothetical protein